MENKSIIFMGTPDFAVSSLLEIQKAGIEIKAVVTQPDKQRGRGKKVSFTPVKKAAIELGIPVLQPIKMRNKDFIEQLKELNADLFVVVAFRILPKKVLEIPPLGSINLHASLLPNYRGAAPINHALFNGDKKTGLTVFFLNSDKVDSGNVVEQIEVEIDDDDNFGSLYDKLKIEGSSFLPTVINNIFNNNIKTSQQDISTAVNLDAPKIFPEHFKIDWNHSAESIHNQVRGLAPKPGAFCSFNDKRLKIIETSIDNIECNNSSGEIIEIDRKNNSISVSTGKGILKLHRVQPEGKAVIDASSFINGYSIKVGMIFISPEEL
ncbi:MAG: methionyl-tRNA formyltransferase [Candidatus Delongbacteria bacterium]|jgi:methionyl-tRNA formyltransferase|nr:methionyl-tRNA formyltransferase [Candidatus Delongbacteria bacterium]